MGGLTLDDLTVEPHQITTSEGEVLDIPGSGYMDGRGDGSPPSTLMTINVWNSADRSRVVCTQKHGAKVDLLDSERNDSEARYYIKIKNGDCEGWVSDPFINPTYQEPVGDQLFD